MQQCPKPRCVYRNLKYDTCDCYEKTWEHHHIVDGVCDHARVRKYVDKTSGEVIEDEDPLAEKFRLLYIEGLVDKEIADIYGVDVRRVTDWRKQNNYVSNRGRVMEEYL